MLIDWNKLVTPEQRAAELVATLKRNLMAEYERRMQVISAPYPPSERESWPVQTQEARAVVFEDSLVSPWIDAAAAARGVDREELAMRIVHKDEDYRAIHGTLTGIRQLIEDSIDAAGDDIAALQAIDVMVGWPAN